MSNRGSLRSEKRRIYFRNFNYLRGLDCALFMINLSYCPESSRWNSISAMHQGFWRRVHPYQLEVVHILGWTVFCDHHFYTILLIKIFFIQYWWINTLFLINLLANIVQKLKKNNSYKLNLFASCAISFEFIYFWIQCLCGESFSLSLACCGHVLRPNLCLFAAWLS